MLCTFVFKYNTILILIVCPVSTSVFVELHCLHCREILMISRMSTLMILLQLRTKQNMTRWLQWPNDMRLNM